jgi:PPOX class probable F420-dependent enzyme
VRGWTCWNTDTVDLQDAIAFAGAHHQSILATVRRDGRPQTSNVMHVVLDGRPVLSVTTDRAKTGNAARDPRVSLHVLGDSFWTYVVLDGTAELSPVAATVDDATVEGLVEYYRAIRGEHPDWSEYRAAMVAERRLLLRINPEHAYGRLPPSG